MEVAQRTDELYCRILSFYLKPDGSISSAAFKRKKGRQPDPACSVYLARLASAEAVRGAGPPHLGVVALPAAVPIDLGLAIVWEPESDDRTNVGYAHFVIQGLATQEQCDRLAESSRVVLAPASPHR